MFRYILIPPWMTGLVSLKIFKPRLRESWRKVPGSKTYSIRSMQNRRQFLLIIFFLLWALTCNILEVDRKLTWIISKVPSNIYGQCFNNWKTVWHTKKGRDTGLVQLPILHWASDFTSRSTSFLFFKKGVTTCSSQNCLKGRRKYVQRP